MPSINSLWIPVLVTSHVLAVALFFYALERIGGAVTYWIWSAKYKLYLSRKYKGDYKMAWYWTYPGAKAAYDAQQAADAMTEEQKLAWYKQATAGMEVPMPVEVAWNNLVYRVKIGNPPVAKTVIHKCSGTLNSAESYAIMGPSGAGKSTMLDLLAGRKIGKGIHGDITYNGKQVTAENASKFASYVSQEDVFVPTLTVWEALEFYTSLSLPGSFTKAERRTRMESALATMGLHKVKSSKVGGYMSGGVGVRGISGGERRRLSVACGLVACPSVLFLDEPTTGLDSSAALAVMKHLIGLTKWGLTIAASIHQPRQDIFEAFDRILVVSEGYQVFLAPPAYALHWFSNVLGLPYDVDMDGTVADWLISIVSITFFKSKEAGERSFASKASVRDAAKKFNSLQAQADAEGQDMIENILDTPTHDNTPVGTSLQNPGAYRSVMNSWLMGSLANQALLQSQLHASDSTIAKTRDQIKAAQQEEAELDDLEGADWVDEFDLRRNYPRRWFVQFWVLFKRSFWSNLRNPAACAVRLLMVTWVCMFSGLVYIRQPNNPTSTAPRLATLFFSTMLFQMNPFSFMSFFLADRRFFLRDSANGLYAPSAYLAASFLGSAPFIIINTWAGSLTLYGLTGLRNEVGAIFVFVCIVTLHALCAQQFCVFCVWLFETQDSAFTLGSLYVSTCLVLLGFYIRIPDIRLSFMKGLSWACFSKYTFQGLAINELQNRPYDLASCKSVTPLPLSGGAIPSCSLVLAHNGTYYPGDPYTTGDDVLRYFGFRLTVGICIAAQLSFLCLFIILSYLALLKMFLKRR